MKRVVYRSISNLGPNDVGMLNIIRACDRNNEPTWITGMLWFDGRFFLHVIEGPDDAVNALFLKLRRDTRHRSLYVTDVRRIETRRYELFGVRFRHGLAAFDPSACGATRTGVLQIRDATAGIETTLSYRGELGQVATLPH